NAYNTFTGGTVVEAGTLLLTAGGANGTLTGELTVNAGATVNYTASNAFGWNAGASVNKLNINGGTVGGNDVPNHFWNSFQLTMTGGVLYQGGDASVQYNEWHNPTITILESAQTAQMLAVSANAAMRIRNDTWAKFDVRNGPADVDLLVDIPITYQTGSSGITKIGEGVMKVQKNINIANLYVAGGNLVLAGDSTSSADFLAVGLSEPWVVGGSSPATLTIQDNASLTVRAVHMGENYQNPIMGMIAEIRQTGGTFTVTGYNEDPGSPTPYNKGALRIGHWPNETSTYYLSGGNLVIQNAEAGILLATDGNGTFYQTGGTANATFVKLNTRPSGSGTGIFTLEGGTFIMGSGGFVTDAGPYQLNLGGAGPTLRAAADWASSLNMTLSGTGANAIHFDTNGYTVTLSGVLSGAGGLRKLGAGDLVLSGANTYQGGTTVLAGRLLVNNTSGSGTGTGDVVVQGGLLGGNGTIGGNVLVQAGAALSAGNSPGHLTIQQNYTQQDEGTLLVELAGYT
ncbi:MAG TPA: autotransporter-associated beta strand repeat-containing protein, partial [Thermoguttaceae bacterium]|nr:autotransporter-associated beta strand repeat-containing protein [Thermoguttaceae bacterium]